MPDSINKKPAGKKFSLSLSSESIVNSMLERKDALASGLGTIQSKLVKTRHSPEDELKPLEIGFDRESILNSFGRNLSRSYKNIVNKIKLSGLLKNINLWIVGLTNLAISGILFFSGMYFSDRLPDGAGYNIDDDKYADFAAGTGIFLLPGILHALVIIVCIIFVVYSGSKLNSVYKYVTINSILLFIVEFIALRNLAFVFGGL